VRIGLSRRNFLTRAAASAVIATPRISAAAGPTIRVQPDNDLWNEDARCPLEAIITATEAMIKETRALIIKIDQILATRL
jgi:hypothetical protein